jgi:hypothetical protein
MSQSKSTRAAVGMVSRRVVLRARDVVFFKGVIEANEGLAAVLATHGGDLVVTAPAERSDELDVVLRDLRAELGAVEIEDGSVDAG